MSSFKSTAALSALAFATGTLAHGHISGITVNGAYFQGPDPSLRYQNPPPQIAGWLAENTDNGFVLPSAFSSPDIICHRGARPGAISIPVEAGSEIQLHWNTWPESHHGPVIDYLAPCNGDCAAVDPSSLSFTKIQEAGLNDGSFAPGNWASDALIANNNTAVTRIPASVAPGNYVLRHEIIGLHEGNRENGAQMYPQCINLQVTGGGSDALGSGTPGTALYTAQDPGILFDIYRVMDSYPIPGPAVMAGGGAGNGAPAGSEEQEGGEEEQHLPSPEPQSSFQPEIPVGGGQGPTTMLTSTVYVSEAAATTVYVTATPEAGSCNKA